MIWYVYFSVIVAYFSYRAARKDGEHWGSALYAAAFAYVVWPWALGALLVKTLHDLEEDL